MARSKRKEREESAPIGTARITLSKAHFFLKQADRSARDIEAYECYVEAALVFARTVLDHLEREYGGKLKSKRKVEFKNWIRRRKLDPLIEALIEKRDSVIHIRPMSIIRSQKDTFYLENSLDEASEDVKAAHELLPDQLDEIGAIIEECERMFK
jgi:hypothetical protein